ncbi:MAG TPA: NAD+ synthase [Longimicrobiales bacterium]|nr:NAD+ synthase [Longimicrobiales bacterium]
MSCVRVGLAQMNATVGAVEANVAKIRDQMEAAREQGVDVIAFPELAVCGYPPEDLLLKPGFIAANREAVEALAPATTGITAVVGFADRRFDLFNAAAVLHDGRWLATYHKQRLPNYGVFDELRYFKPGVGELLVCARGAWIGISVCEDIWLPGGPVGRLARAGADVIVNINASPYHRGKQHDRHRMLATRASDYAVAIAYVNLVGGQDELVFDGGSLVFGPEGELLASAPTFREHLLVCDIELEQVFRARLHDPRRRHTLREEPASVTRVFAGDPSSHEKTAHAVARGPGVAEPAGNAEAHVAAEAGAGADASQAQVMSSGPLHRPDADTDRAGEPSASGPVIDDLAEVYAALVLGTRDYVEKNGFSRVVLGLSGGIDSALVAVIAADALGRDRVTGVKLPSRYSSEGSLRDAEELGAMLGIDLLEIGIEPVFEASLEVLRPLLHDMPPDVTEENLQSRARGMLLMALSNKFGWMLLTTGNKSEVATGYATLYGDMAGGFAVLKDVPKTLVYELSRWRNAQPGGVVIPVSTIEKPPSAELRPDQTDQDSLPPYPILDAILEKYVEEDWSVGEIVAEGFDEVTVRRVVTLVDRSEYKRRQAAPGVKITPRAFGKDRRLPITSAFRGR